MRRGVYTTQLAAVIGIVVPILTDPATPQEP